MTHLTPQVPKSRQRRISDSRLALEMVFSIVFVLISKFQTFIFEFSVFNEETSFSEILVKVPSIEDIAIEIPTSATPAKYSSNLERPKRQKIEAEVGFEEN